MATYDLHTNEDGFVKSNCAGCAADLVACGVPPRGAAPRCLYLQTGKAERPECCGWEGKPDWSWQLEPVFGADGLVEVKGTGALDADARLLVGRRPLAFP